MRFVFASLCFALLALHTSSIYAQNQDKLKVGIKASPPAAIKEGSEWTGLSVTLWERIAEANDWSFEYQEMSIAEMMTALQSGRIDISIAPLSITPQREAEFDFSYPIYSGGLAVAVPNSDVPGWVSGLQNLFSGAFLKAIIALGVVLLVTGALMWIFERKANPEQFGGPAVKGLGAGFWWSAVTMTTVGYGDKSPVTFGGRVIGLIWMFTSIIIISGFTAAIATAITVSTLSSDLSDKPLNRMRVATVEGSSAEAYLDEERIRSIKLSSIETAMNHVVSGEADAVVYDEPILAHYINKGDRPSLALRPELLTSENYAFGLPENSDILESLNRSLLQIQRSTEWKDLFFKYLGN